MHSYHERKAMTRILFSLFTLMAVIMAGCAGPNPNPGERTSDMAWNQGNFTRAFEVVKPRAMAGEPWAQLRLGIFFENGWGTAKDNEQAEYWYKQAAAQKATGDWADGKLIGAAGKAGYFNQNSDARIAQFNLAQLYYVTNKNLPQAKRLIDSVIEETNGNSVFFCCEFAGGRYFTNKQFMELKQKIEERMVAP